MVFYDMTFDNIKTAKAVKDSLVVLGVMIKVLPFKQLKSLR